MLGRIKEYIGNTSTHYGARLHRWGRRLKGEKPSSKLSERLNQQNLLRAQGSKKQNTNDQTNNPTQPQSVNIEPKGFIDKSKAWLGKQWDKTKEFANNFRKQEWSNLEKGALMLTGLGLGGFSLWRLFGSRNNDDDYYYPDTQAIYQTYQNVPPPPPPSYSSTPNSSTVVSQLEDRARDNYN